MIDAERQKIVIQIFLPLLIGLLAISVGKIFLAYPFANIVYGLGAVISTYAIVMLLNHISLASKIDASENILTKNVLLFLLLDAFIAIQVPYVIVSEFLSSLILISIVFITSIPLLKKGVFKQKIDDLPVLIPTQKPSILRQFRKFFLYSVLAIIILILLVFVGSLAVYSIKKSDIAAIAPTQMEFALA